MKKPFDYELFMYEIEKNYICLNYLMYSKNLAYLHIIDKHTQCNFNKNFTQVDRLENAHDHSKHLYLNEAKIEGLIFDLAQRKKWDYNITFDYITKTCNQFLRARVINIVYELIAKYVTTNKGIQMLRELHNFDWFKILFVLRNTVSHADNYNKPIQFPVRPEITKYPDTIKWRTIEITRGQMDSIRYNDKEIFELIEYIKTFFESNSDYQP